MSASSPPVGRRRRRRRGSVDRPVDGRLYRAAFLVLILPLLIAALTIGQPKVVATPTALPPAFEAHDTLTLAQELANNYPSREPGSANADQAADWFRSQVGHFGLETTTDTWHETIRGLGKNVQLQNISAVVPGRSNKTIIVMAHRDDTGVGLGADDNATGTAALIELAQAYAQPTDGSLPAVQATHRIVFLSTDGGAYGGLGALRAAKSAGGNVVAVVNLDALDGKGPPRLEFAGDLPRSSAASLIETAARRIRDPANAGRWPEHPGVFDQLVDLGFPFTLYEQGPFVARGIPAVTLTTSGDRPRHPLGDIPQRLGATRLGQMGLSAEALLRSLDAGADLTHGTTTYVWLGNRVIRGWAVELVLIALFVPFVVGAIDLFAYCRRRRLRFGPAARSLLSRLGVVFYAALVFVVFGWLGAWPSGPPRPPNPALAITGDWPAVALFGLLVFAGAGWLLTRPSRAPRGPVEADDELAGHAVALLALVLLGLTVIATNPFALLFVLPACHAWLWLAVLRTRPLLVRLGMFAVGLVGPLFVLLSFGIRFKLGFDAPWYLIQLVTVGYVTVTPVVLALIGLAIAAQIGAIAARRYAPYPSRDERGPRGPIREFVRSVALAGRRRQPHQPFSRGNTPQGNGPS